jgi:Flp pilus assembly protein TadD/predicted phosphodiesterase
MSHNLTWLHLSDIHFNPRTEWRYSASRDALLEYLKAEPLQPDLVFCTGDIAFGETNSAPLKNQYTQARDFFDKLLAIWHLPKDRLFVVPGNHDINRNSVNPDAQATLTQWAEQAPEHAQKINQRFADRPKVFQDAIARLNEYASFVSEYLPHQVDTDGRHCYAHVLDINGLKVGVAGFNSVWSCAGLEDDRHLWMAAEWQFNSAKPKLKDAAVRIGLIHHPVDWLNTVDRDLATRRIAADFHFWLHGHSHNAWVEPGQGHTVIAAGAVGAEASEEFGVNWVTLDLVQGEGTVHLHDYSRSGYWAIKPEPPHAPKALWPLSLPAELHQPVKSMPPVVTPTASLPPKRDPGFFGRAALLKDAAAKLNRQPVLLVYGLRGNGKSELIKALGQTEPLVGKEALRYTVNAATTANELFRQFSTLLGETAESPRPPTGNTKAIEAELRRRYPRPRPAWVWIEQAHQLIDGQDFRHPEVRSLLLGLQAVLGTQWRWVFELRERPVRGLWSTQAEECEVPGLDKASLGDCLAHAAPPDEEAEWCYQGDKLKRIYQWLGGGHGGQAHTQAAQLLIEVARGHGETPMQALERHLDDFEKSVEKGLLHDLYSNVLNDAERHLLQALALYRTAVPHDHADALERHLRLVGSWDGLDRRCLLSPSADHAKYYLHQFIAAWLRVGLGYANHGEDPEADFADATDEAGRHDARRLHQAVAACWMEDLGHKPRLTRLNMDRALEAFHHLAAGGEPERIQDIAVELLTGNRAWALRRIEQLDDYLYRSHVPVAQRRKALEYWVALDAENHKAQRFLGECWAKEHGWASAKALACFEAACRLQPDFPPYWTNLGKSLLAQGETGAREFLQRVKAEEQLRPQLLNEHGWAVRADCLNLIGDTTEANKLRWQRIQAGSNNPAFYNGEAQALLKAGDAEGALAVLKQAERNRATDDYTDAIRAQALQQAGRTEEAARLRQSKIQAGSNDPVFYNAEAQARLDGGDAEGALAVLKQAERNRVTDDYTDAIRAQALQQAGRTEEAARLRQSKIQAGSNNPAFYSDEAQARLKADDAEGALAVLKQAERNRATDGYTDAIRAAALRRLGRA